MSKVVTKLLEMSNTLMIDAAIVSSLPGVANRGRPDRCGSSVGSALDQRHDENPGFESGEPERQSREEQDARSAPSPAGLPYSR